MSFNFDFITQFFTCSCPKQAPSTPNPDIVPWQCKPSCAAPSCLATCHQETQAYGARQ